MGVKMLLDQKKHDIIQQQAEELNILRKQVKNYKKLLNALPLQEIYYKERNKYTIFCVKLDQLLKE